MSTYTVVLVLYLIITFIVGIFAGKIAGKKSNGSEGFCIGGRTIGPWVLASTWGATLISASTVIGVTGYGWKNGWAGVIWGGICMTFGGLLAYVLLGKRLRVLSERLNTVTIPGLIFARYESEAINTIIAIMICAFYIPMLMTQFVSAGVLMETIFNIPYITGIIIFGVIVVVYTSVGGFLAVAYTDFVQAIVMVACFLVATPMILDKVGGFTGLATAMANVDPGMLSPNGVNNAFPPLLILSWIVYYVFGSCGQPYMLIRCTTARDLKTLKKALPIAMIFITWMYFNVSVFGFAGRVLMPDLAAQDAVMPAMINIQLGGVLGGIMIAAIVAAMMSTVDSTLHVVGTAVSKDVYSRLRPNATDAQVLRVSQIATLLIGVIGVAASTNRASSVLELSTYGWTCLSAALFMPVVGGLCWKRFNTAGALASMLGGGISGAVIIGLLGNFSFLGCHPFMIALPIGVICGVVATLLTPPPKKEIIDVFFDPTIMTAKDGAICETK